MRHTDLSAGRGKLQRTMENYRNARVQVLAAWNDDVARQFRQQFLDPVEPRFVRAVDAIQRLAEVLAQAERACGPD
jgi:hypothetical protein